MALAWALRLAFSLSPRVPLSWRYRVGRLGCEAVYWCWRTKRRHTQQNMAVVVGEARARQAARLSWRNYGNYVVDFLNLPSLQRGSVEARTRVEGWENMDRALAKGRGAILVSLHYGVWDYAAGIAARRYPDRLSIITEPFTSPQVEALVQGQRAREGSKILEMTKVRQMVRLLRANEMICILVDRPVQDEDAVVVEFFGKPIRIPGGAAALSLMSGAAIVPATMHHALDGDGFSATIWPAIDTTKTGDRAADVQRITQDIFRMMETVVRRDPEHWYMFRDMWGAAASLPAARAEKQDVSAPPVEARA